MMPIKRIQWPVVAILVLGLTSTGLAIVGAKSLLFPTVPACCSPGYEPRYYGTDWSDPKKPHPFFYCAGE